MLGGSMVDRYWVLGCHHRDSKTSSQNRCAMRGSLHKANFQVMGEHCLFKMKMGSHNSMAHWFWQRNKPWSWDTSKALVPSSSMYVCCFEQVLSGGPNPSSMNVHTYLVPVEGQGPFIMLKNKELSTVIFTGMYICACELSIALPIAMPCGCGEMRRLSWVNPRARSQVWTSFHLNVGGYFTMLTGYKFTSITFVMYRYLHIYIPIYICILYTHTLFN